MKKKISFGQVFKVNCPWGTMSPQRKGLNGNPNQVAWGTFFFGEKREKGTKC
jgi:hypothetical protein